MVVHGAHALADAKDFSLQRTAVARGRGKPIMWAPLCCHLQMRITNSRQFASSWHHTSCHVANSPDITTNMCMRWHINLRVQATIAATNGAALRIKAALDALEADNLAAQRLPVSFITLSCESFPRVCSAAPFPQGGAGRPGGRQSRGAAPADETTLCNSVPTSAPFTTAHSLRH
jgi:hypothetical protein